MANVAELETRTAELLCTFESHPAALLCARPSATGWSALQVLDHLVKTEEGILAIARQGAEKRHPIGVRDRIAFRFLMTVFKTDRQVRVPSAASQLLPDEQTLSYEALRERWRATRVRLQEFSSGLTLEQARSGLFRHPVGGWMGMDQIIDFFWVHIVHHEFQLRRLGLGTRGL